MSIQLKKLKSDAQVPVYKTDGSAGMDVYAYIETGFTILEPGERKVIDTGISIQLNKGTWAGIYSRSGLASKYGVIVLNAPGVIDNDYTGEIKIILMNTSNTPFKINHGDRIAQLIIHKLEKDGFEEVTEFQRTTDRGEGGLGSTGV